MKLYMLKIMVLISTITPTMKTPMSLGIMLIIQTMVSTLILTKLSTSSWISMVVFLMFIGGLLILFMYMSSIASNEKFSPNLKIMLLVIILALPTEELMSDMQINEFMEMSVSQETMSMIKNYNKKTLMITIALFMYMFLTMIVVNSIIKIFKGPLRSK